MGSRFRPPPLPLLLGSIRMLQVAVTVSHSRLHVLPAERSLLWCRAAFPVRSTLLWKHADWQRRREGAWTCWRSSLGAQPSAWHIYNGCHLNGGGQRCANLSQSSAMQGERGRANRVTAAYCFTILHLQVMVVDGQQGCRILMMDDEPLTVCALIKWQIITQEFCICLWGTQTFIL